MKKKNLQGMFLFLIALFFTGQSVSAQTWDILNKSMGPDYTSATGGVWYKPQAAGVITQETGYVNFKKVTGVLGWTWLKPNPAFANLTSGTAYSVEVKVRVNASGTTSTNEANQISLRLQGSSNLIAPIFLKYGNGVTGGSVTTVVNGTNAYTLNTSEWQIYRFVLHADHLKYDVYVAGVEEPIFENIAITSKSSESNGVYFGAETNYYCDMDIEYAKVGTGDFYYKPRISNPVILSSEGHMKGNNVTNITVTANTVGLNGEQVMFSLVDGSNIAVTDVTSQTITVANNVAVATLTIPANVPAGQYKVKVNATGQVGGVDVTPKTSPYTIAPTSEWDMVDKTMTAWNAGNYLDKPWVSYVGSNLTGGADRYSFTQENGYVNLTKTYCTANSNSLTLSTPNILISTNTPYTVEYKARINPIDKGAFPDVSGAGKEMNWLSVRIENTTSALYFAYDADGNGYVTLNSNILAATPAEKIAVNIGEWNLYRFVLSADRTTFDLYVNGTIVFDDKPTTSTTGTNILSLGAGGWDRCNMDVEYAKMGTGDLGPGTPTSVVLPVSKGISIYPSVVKSGEKLTINAENADKLLVEIIDLSGNRISSTKINNSFGEIQTPATSGLYFVKVTTNENQVSVLKVIVK